ncbi:MAG: SGNH/GDSL hydrolase family protein [Actinomycetota bacterium]
MTAILCYGDSNTWGYEASTQERLGRWDRWPGVMQRELGDDVHVIEEGQNGRTTVFDVPFEPNRNGLSYLPVSLETHHPLDAVVIDLGTNDLSLPGVNAYHAAHGALKLAEIVLTSDAGPAGGAPAVLVLVPPPFAPLGAWDQGESPDAERESQRLSQAFVDAAAGYGQDQMDISLLDLRDHVTSSPIDGIHLEADDHRAIGLAIAGRLRALLDLGSPAPPGRSNR